MAGLVLGLLLGLRHAFEPDHLAAISTLVEARGRRSTAVIGACWGLGHAIALLVVGSLLAAFEMRLPSALASAFEIVVAAMLILLGARAFARARRLGTTGGAPAAHRHHGALVHAHAGVIEHVHVGPWTFAWRPLLVGLVHGLAGSGALTALVMAKLPTLPARLAYIALFGAGSIAGMAALTGVAGWQLARVRPQARLARGLSFATGTLSVGLGGWWGFAAVAALLQD